MKRPFGEKAAIRTAFPIAIGCLIVSTLAQSKQPIPLDRLSLQTSILNDIITFNASCSPKDSCRLDKISRISDPPDWDKRNCLCDEFCTVFGDCCPDSKRFVEAAREQPDPIPFSCEQLKQYNFNWIVNKCPNEWREAKVRSACENETAEWQVHLDPIGYMPVTSTRTGITYRNINCAVCHRDTPQGVPEGSGELRFWNPRLECSSILAGNPAINKIDKETLAEKVHWDDGQNMWGIVVNVNSQGEKFHPCYIDPSLPDDLQPYLRPCQPSINSCPPEWSDDETREKCQSYTSFVYRPANFTASVSAATYRNVHCALCNQVQPWELSCNSVGISFRQLTSPRDFNPSAFALLFDLKDSDGSGVVGKHRSCQGDQLFDPFSRKCRQVFCSESGTFYHDGQCLSFIPSSSTTDFPVTSTPESTSKATTTQSANEEDVHWKTTQTEHHPTFTVTTANISPATGSSSPVPDEPTTTHAPAGTSESGAPQDFSSCPKFLLNDDEVEWYDNGTLYVPAYDKSYAAGHYSKDKSGGVLVCAQGVSLVSKFDPVLGWVTVAGLGLSEVCLALHLIAFIISPELRNLSGRNLASLSLALFVAYGSFIAAQFTPTGGSSLCVGLAVSIFYFFLAAFWWTSVLAWDVWRTIRLATVQLRCSSSGQQCGKFILYSLYAWLSPALVVVAAVTIEWVGKTAFPWIPADYYPRFGQNVCWFGQRKAVLLYFALPLAVILSVNLLLFISSAYMIRTTTMKSPVSSNQNSSRKQLGLYVRLALIMGLSWIFGLIAGAADIMPLWYVFVALCSMQGVFILLAYTCNPKVARSIRNRLLVCRSNQRRQSTYRTALVGGGLKEGHLHRLGLEARDSHDSQVSNASQASQTSRTSQTTLSKTSSP